MSSAALATRLEIVARAIEGELEALLALDSSVPPRLVRAMRYAVLGAGKRLRPFLVHAAGEIAGAEPAACHRVGAAIELLHCYSLVHDDLPAMDDAEFRRGKPSCHRAFDEATAILAGDALVALAFEAVARQDWPCTAELRAGLLADFARAAGAQGMCGGQVLDLESSEGELAEAELVRLQQLKTGALISFALEAGCRLGRMPEPQRRAIACYADCLGLAFQIRDDLLDTQGTPAETGKDPGRDLLLGRTTFVSLLGARGAEQRLLQLREQALTVLEARDLKSAVLAELFDFVISRRS
jgi:farnesyl diphosphate synthase